MKDWHVYPNNDFKEHNTNSKECRCNPRVEGSEDDTCWIVIHKAYDMREYREEEQVIN
uniref:Uncharacterized protein n=1 Tax=viral metagenome TaxID=1070528 RepID=A0A6H2A639_9ZZZZ